MHVPPCCRLSPTAAADAAAAAAAVALDGSSGGERLETETDDASGSSMSGGGGGGTKRRRSPSTAKQSRRAAIRHKCGTQGVAKLVQATTRLYIGVGQVREWLGEVEERRQLDVKVQLDGRLQPKPHRGELLYNKGAHYYWVTGTSLRKLAKGKWFMGWRHSPEEGLVLLLRSPKDPEVKAARKEGVPLAKESAQQQRQQMWLISHSSADAGAWVRSSGQQEAERGAPSSPRPLPPGGERSGGMQATLLPSDGGASGMAPPPADRRVLVHPQYPQAEADHFSTGGAAHHLLKKRPLTEALPVLNSSGLWAQQTTAAAALQTAGPTTCGSAAAAGISAHHLGLHRGLLAEAPAGGGGAATHSWDLDSGRLLLGARALPPPPPARSLEAAAHGQARAAELGLAPSPPFSSAGGARSQSAGQHVNMLDLDLPYLYGASRQAQVPPYNSQQHPPLSGWGAGGRGGQRSQGGGGDSGASGTPQNAAGGGLLGLQVADLARLLELPGLEVAGGRLSLRSPAAAVTVAVAAAGPSAADNGIDRSHWAARPRPSPAVMDLTAAEGSREALPLMAAASTQPPSSGRFGGAPDKRCSGGGATARSHLPLAQEAAPEHVPPHGPSGRTTLLPPIPVPPHIADLLPAEQLPAGVWVRFRVDSGPVVEEAVRCRVRVDGERGARVLCDLPALVLFQWELGRWSSMRDGSLLISLRST
ncbi:hypothetical protein HYH03_009450 [Edaphochlamys debaryana]|uniref:Uncharacterized protein n=1 Tax=Edaphochlamys debaryana TaxID=47281 RepID=A0A835Y054_9CHLO|nr:hypothetical protein HYH03_009450 [Edaphochlamys debaryana]|eukprot:KAG2492203.1 hypothetical protein HYH03_009450 [Edaphochlamys debaryana]